MPHAAQRPCARKAFKKTLTLPVRAPPPDRDLAVTDDREGVVHHHKTRSAAACRVTGPFFKTDQALQTRGLRVRFFQRHLKALNRFIGPGCFPRTADDHGVTSEAENHTAPLMPGHRRRDFLSARMLPVTFTD